MTNLLALDGDFLFSTHDECWSPVNYAKEGSEQIYAILTNRMKVTVYTSLLLENRILMKILSVKIMCREV